MHPPQHLQTSAQLHHSKVVQFTQRSNTTHDRQAHSDLGSFDVIEYADQWTNHRQIPSVVRLTRLYSAVKDLGPPNKGSEPEQWRQIEVGSETRGNLTQTNPGTMSCLAQAG